MIHYKGEERILYLKIDGEYLPIGCLTENSFSESSESFETTIKSESSWAAARILNQNYSISFSGIQILSNIGNTNMLSYDRLKEIKRNRQLLDWKIKGATYPIVDYGKCYITEISEATPVDELITFSGTLTGFGKPRFGVGEIAVDCVLSDWSEWSECEDGTQTRTRTVITAPENGGNACGALSESRPCETPPTPIDCVVSDWSEWGVCVNGSQERTRTIITSPENGGLSCPVLSEVRACTVEPYTISKSSANVFAQGSTVVANFNTTIQVNVTTANFRIGVKMTTGSGTATGQLNLNGTSRTVSGTSASYTYSSVFALTQGTYNSSIFRLTVAPTSGTAIGDMIIEFVP
jgi:hypothetical protein